jgi:monoamine oxidase
VAFFTRAHRAHTHSTSLQLLTLTPANIGLCETELVARVPGPRKLDVTIIGAGAAGLAALAELDRAGVSVVCLEARDRIGGRILTVHDPSSPIPIELGAEFIHGRPPETWDIISAAGLAAYDCAEDAVYIEGGRVVDNADAWLPVDDIMSEMQRAAEEGPDQSFASFLATSSHPDGAKKVATSYVEGFNAARDDRIGIASLALDSRAAKDIDGDRSFRLLNGYDAVPAFLLGQTKEHSTAVRLNSIVERVRWRKNSVSVSVRSALTGLLQTFESSRLIVTVPLGVLQAETGEIGAIYFDPPPVETLAAVRKLCFGQVFRTVLRFTHRILEQREELADIGFLLSDEPAFPTWWSTLPIRTRLITGWSAGRKAEPLMGRTREFIIGEAIGHLARITSLDVNALHSGLAAAQFHDWSSDPFSRGAYSYVPPDGLPARELLAQPVDDTLYFSAEATETNGHGATVHGAIASGKRAAHEILRNLR